MKRSGVVAAISAVFLVVGVMGAADAHFRKANGKRVSKKHARMHRGSTGNGGGGGSGGGSTTPSANASLQMYEAVVSGQQLEMITAAGYEPVDVRNSPDGYRITLVLYPFQRRALEKLGIELTLWHNEDGLTATQLAQQQGSSGYKVYRDNDGPDGFAAYIEDLAVANPDITELEQIGTTLGTTPDPDTGAITYDPRPIYALQLTENADGFEGDQKPAVLYESLQHAREWISGEVNRRLLEWLIKGYRSGHPEVKSLLGSTELWFVLVANPDGYQWTFDGDRLWRKNMRDNDGDGYFTALDGVDLNRNFPEHWNFDDEGSSTLTSSETYRGESAASEPETQAMMELYENVDFAFHNNYHSYGELLLYTFGFQTNTPSADDPIYVALTGTDKQPAVQHFDPGVGADLYTTNGETTDWTHGEQGTLAWTPELSEGPNGDGFLFPDKEGAINSEFNINLDFALDMTKSADDPDDPVSHLGNTTEPFYLDVSEIDPQKTDNPLSDFTFPFSYGDPQEVRVLAKRDLDDDGSGDDPVTVHWRIGGDEFSAPTGEWNGGERFGATGDDYYRIMSGEVGGFDTGDSVEVWFTGGGQTSPSFTFTAVNGGEPDDVLILAAEDYSGAANNPAYPAGGSPTPPHYLSYYANAITASGRTWDLYDVDAMGRQAPHNLGVLSHYDAVVWYTGTDYLTREPGQTPGTGASTLANSELLQVRAFLNEGGRLLYTGRHAGWQYANAFDYNPVSSPPFCDGTVNESTGIECQPLSDDFLQYWLGAYVFVEDGGTTVDGEPAPIEGTASPYDPPFEWTLNGGTSADNHHANPIRGTTQSLVTTSSLLKTSTYPQFTSIGPAKWDTGISGAYSPKTGSYYVYSDRADVSFKRLTRGVTVPGGGGNLTFQISRDTEPNWDYVFVEVHDLTAGTWQTVPDQNGHTDPEHSTGESCPAGWHELHPWLAHYQGADCSGTGDFGDWNAATGRSSGWEEWDIDLTPFAGHDIEVSISYASDWAVQGLGAWVDDVTFSWEGTTESFETGLGGWTPGGEPTSAPNPNNWYRTTDVGFTEAAVVGMDPPGDGFRTLYFGFGFEGITTEAQRNEVMDRSLDYLLA